MRFELSLILACVAVFAAADPVQMKREACPVKDGNYPPCLDRQGNAIPPRKNCPPMVDQNHFNCCRVCA